VQQENDDGYNRREEMVSAPDRVVFSTDSVTIGAFRCAVDHPSFRDSGPIQQDCFVFPRTAVVIQHDRGAPFVADPTIVTLYNRAQAYKRRPVSPEGDRCDWYAVAPDILREALAPRDAAAADGDRPIRFAHAPADPVTYYRQRRLFVDVCRANGAPADILAVEERVVALLDDVLGHAYRVPRARATGLPRDGQRAADLADAAKLYIERRMAARLTVAWIARGIGCSVFHLCRSFRRATGQTLHAYREQVRLSAALERLEDGENDLTRLALDLGYSSHSHFSAAFRQSFPATPSQARRALAGGTARATFR
jgi:AraC family transcriptional regulator